jgi:hypothetical protein
MWVLLYVPKPVPKPKSAPEPLATRARDRSCSWEPEQAACSVVQQGSAPMRST